MIDDVVKELVDASLLCRHWWWWCFGSIICCRSSKKSDEVTNNGDCWLARVMIDVCMNDERMCGGRREMMKK